MILLQEQGNLYHAACRRDSTTASREGKSITGGGKGIQSKPAMIKFKDDVGLRSAEINLVEQRRKIGKQGRWRGWRHWR